MAGAAVFQLSELSCSTVRLLLLLLLFRTCLFPLMNSKCQGLPRLAIIDAVVDTDKYNWPRDRCNWLIGGETLGFYRGSHQQRQSAQRKGHRYDTGAARGRIFEHGK